MPVFSYQSFNANSAHEHDLHSLTGQQHTIKAHDRLATFNGGQDQALIFPTLPEEKLANDGLLKPVQGPARLVPTAAAGTIVSKKDSTAGKADTGDFLSMMQQKVLQNRQAVYREMKSMPDVTAFGELDTGHAQLASVETFAGQRVGISSNLMACHSFSVFANNSGNVDILGSGDGWYAIKYLGYVVVFVHVPNDIAGGASKKAKAKAKPTVISGGVTKKTAKKKVVVATGAATLLIFYQQIYNTLIQRGWVIDVIMGDTNQSRSDLTSEVVSQATGFTFKNAYSSRAITPIDTFNVSFNGTNSVAEEMFDVAVYNTKTVAVEKICYWTQQAPFRGTAGVAAVTDHMGLAIKVEKVKA